MGMFDTVAVQAPCGKCGKMIAGDEWQSKDGPCQLIVLPQSVVFNLYAHCPHCKTWNEYMRPVPWGDDYSTWPRPPVEALGPEWRRIHPEPENEKAP